MNCLYQTSSFLGFSTVACLCFSGSFYYVKTDAALLLLGDIMLNDSVNSFSVPQDIWDLCFLKRSTSSCRMDTNPMMNMTLRNHTFLRHYSSFVTRPILLRGTNTQLLGVLLQWQKIRLHISEYKTTPEQ